MSSNENLIEIFEFALRQEVYGKGFFEHSLKEMGNHAARSAVRRLIEEEEKHIEMIERILTGLRSGARVEGAEARAVNLKGRYLFNEHEKAEFLKECMEDSGSPDACIFNTAWLMEKDLSKFYSRMADRTEGEAGKALRMLSQWEAGHADFFREYRDRLSRVYSGMYGPV